MTSVDRRTVLVAGAAAATGLSMATAGCAPGHSEEARKGPATVKKSDVPVGGGLVLSDANFVVTQPVAGEFHAFVKICRHAGCAVSTVTDKDILCPCHGSKFSVKDGSVLQGPAAQPLSPATLADKGETLEVSA